MSAGKPRAATAAWLATVGLVLTAAIYAASPPIDRANDAWEQGDYAAALSGYIQLLSAPGGERYLDAIAMRTGELFQTRELTTDGRAPRFSADGTFIVYETGLETSRTTKIVDRTAPERTIVTLPGISATFSQQLAQVAYLRIPEHEDIRDTSNALARASLTASNRSQLTQTLAWFIAKYSTLVVRDLASGREMELPTPGLLKAGLTFGADGRELYFLGASDRDPDSVDIYTISERAPKPVVVADVPGLKSAPIVDRAGNVLLYTVPAQSPLRRPTAPTGDAAGTTPGAASQGGQPVTPARANPPPPQFVVVDLATHTATTIAGSAPSLSADGRRLAYIARRGSDYALMIGPPRGPQAAVKTTAQRLDAPALSADGSRVAFQQMLVDDWEIVVAARDGSDERRVTREIQHDVLPRFLSADRLVAMVGEPRHRRSYLYDLASTTGRVRLFHNNTVRTIAPEYQWAASPDGGELLVGAERDGDTVSPRRGVYLVDLHKRVTKAALLDRLRANLKAELALKATATHLFTPVAAEIREMLARTSVSRIFGYEKALFDFDSKHISKPGNGKAAEFLFNTYQSFGYAPEYQRFEARAALDGKTANVIATLRGTVNPELVYVVSSHFDSVEAGPGADDDTSGTAALLEAARVLADHPLPATVIFASFTGEEGGLLGSREFVRRAVDSKRHVVGALNNDTIGWRNDQRLDNTIRYSNPGIRDIQHGAAMLFTRLITYDALYFKGTDAASFYDAYGDVIGGIGSYPVLGSPHYHQATDLLEYEDHQLIAETSRTTIATVMLLASSPSRLTDLRIDSRATAGLAVAWTPSPEKGVTSYMVAYGPPTAPLRHRVTVTQPRAVLPPQLPGTIVSVKAVNARGLEGWDWARMTVGDAPASRTTQP